MASHLTISQIFYHRWSVIITLIVSEMLTISRFYEVVRTSSLTLFFPSTIRAWNSLPQDIKDANIVTAFKYRLNRNRQLPPSTTVQAQKLDKFYMQDYVWSVAPLTHTYTQKNIVPSPSCDCGDFESPYHFLFRCPRYTVDRNTYLYDYLQTHSTHVLLHGKETATDEENRIIFLHVQDFIVKSKRFV